MADEALTAEDILSRDLSSLTDEEFASYYKSTTGQDAFQTVRAPRRRAEYLETVGSILGGIGTGAVAGTLGAGPVGTVVGAIAGGAAGAFGGEILEDLLNNEEVDLSGAVKEAGISAGIDVATLGAGKFIVRPLWRLTKPSALEKNFKALLEEATPTQGSRASKAQTQTILEEGGSSLNPRSMENVSFIRRLSNELGEIGMLSRSHFEADVEKARNVIRGHINRWSSGGTLKDDLGQEFYNTVEAGRKAASKWYGDALEEIAKKAGPRQLPSGEILSAINKFLAKNTDDYGVNLTVETQNIIKTLKSTLSPDGKKILPANFKSMADFQKRLNEVIDAAMPGGATPSRGAVRELSILSAEIKGGVGKALEKHGKPEIYSNYTKLNKEFKDLIDGIMPDMNATLIAGGSRGAFDAIGSALLTRNNTSSLSAFMGSIDKSFAALKKSGQIKDLPKATNSAKKVKSLIRSSYARNMFGDTDDVIFNHKLVNKFNNPDTQKRMAIVFGKEWPEFKKIVNAVGDSLETTKLGMMSLALRGREVGAIAGLGGAGAWFGGGAGAVGSAVTSALALLGLPVVAYKIARNPKAVRALIAADKAVQAKPNPTPEFVLSAAGKIFKALSSEERQELKEEAYNAGFYNIKL